MVSLLHIQSHHQSTLHTDTLGTSAQTVMWPLIHNRCMPLSDYPDTVSRPGCCDAHVQPMAISTHPREWLLVFFVVTPYRLFLFMTFTGILCPLCG